MASGRYPALALELLRQLFIDAAKATVGKNGDHVAWFQSGNDSGDNSIRVGQLARRFAQRPQPRNNRARLKTFVFRYRVRAEYACQDNLICQGQAAYQVFFKDLAAQSVGSRLEDRPQTASGVAGAQRLQGGGNRGGMMGEIIYYSDAIDLCLDLQPPLDTLEAAKSFGNSGRLHAVSRRHSRRRR